jgi:polysaccharide biosynthesis protein PslJ
VTAKGSSPGRRQPSVRYLDAVSLLTVLIVLLFAIPSKLVIGPLGSGGTPAEVFSLGLLAWWAITVVLAQRGPQVRQPVRIGMLLLVTTIMISFICASLRPIEAVESRAAATSTLTAFGWLGILLTAIDAIPSRERLDVLLRRLTIAAGLLAALGILQFLTGQAFTNYIQIPGLHLNNTLGSVTVRNDFHRPAGTALHPLEFVTVLALCLPVALHYAFSDTHRPVLRRSLPAVAIAVAIPISISRSGILSAAAVVAVLLVTWPSRRKLLLTGLVVVAVITYVGAPGLIGTLRDLFTGVAADPGTKSRTGSYPYAWQFLKREPIFGRGFGTFLPMYRVVDGGYLQTIVEIGIAGLAALLGLFGASVGSCVWIRKHSTNERDAGLAGALCASVAALAVTFLTFDSWGYPMANGVTFLLLGCIGALYRVAHKAEHDGTFREELASRPSSLVPLMSEAN